MYTSDTSATQASTPTAAIIKHEKGSLDDLKTLVGIRTILSNQSTIKAYCNLQRDTIKFFQIVLLTWVIASQIIFILTAINLNIQDYSIKDLSVKFDSSVVYTYLASQTVQLIGLFTLAFKWVFSKTPDDLINTATTNQH